MQFLKQQIQFAENLFMIKLTTCLLSFALFLSASEARGLSLHHLDQSYVVNQSGSYSSHGIVSDFRFAQTFRVGTSGLLAQVDVQVHSYAGYPHNPDLLTKPLVFRLNTVLPSGFPSSTTLASVTIPGDQVPLSSPPNLVSLDLTAANIEVTAGQKLAILLSTALPAPPRGQPPVASYGWFFLPENGYADGTSWYSFQFNRWVQQDYDLGFQTYVTPVPEPSSFALLGLGAALLLRLRPRLRPSQIGNPKS
jgi:hypothetical protein